MLSPKIGIDRRSRHLNQRTWLDHGVEVSQTEQVCRRKQEAAKPTVCSMSQRAKSRTSRDLLFVLA
jgi:hypothetical protein